MVTLKPADVHATLGKHLLADGLSLVFDLERSQGAYVYDSRNGRRFLDLFSFFATYPVGINHPRMHEADFEKKMARVAIQNPSNSDIYTVEMAEFVDTFGRVAIPDELPHLFMVAGGTLGVENALKAAFDWKVRKNFARGLKDERGHQVIHFREAFHGRSGYTLSLTNTADPRKTMYFPKFQWPRIINPKIAFPIEDHLDTIIAAESQAISEIEAAVRDNEHDIAALIIEPIQGEGGDNHFRPEFFQRLRELADEHEFMFIVDEVQSGVGLTGEMWACQHFGVRPDMLCFGKKAQVCGFLAGPRIDEVEDNVFQKSSRINSTWGGNLVDMVRFQRYLEIIDEENLVDNARDVGAYLQSRLEGVRESFDDLVSNTRGRGLMCAFDLPDRETRDAFLKAAYGNGILVLGCGQRSVRFRPSLNVAKDTVDQAIELVEKTLKGLPR